MPIEQGYGTELFTCPDCGSSLYFPGSECADCHGLGKPDARVPSKEGPPIPPQPWQLDRIRWQQEEEQRKREVELRQQAVRRKMLEFDEYRAAYRTTRTLIIVGEANVVEAASQIAQSLNFEAACYEQDVENQSAIWSALIETEKVVFIADSMFEAGWRPIEVSRLSYAPRAFATAVQTFQNHIELGEDDELEEAQKPKVVTTITLSVVGDAKTVQAAVQEAKRLGYNPKYHRGSVRNSSVPWEALIKDLLEVQKDLLDLGWAVKT